MNQRICTCRFSCECMSPREQPVVGCRTDVHCPFASMRILGVNVPVLTEYQYVSVSSWYYASGSDPCNGVYVESLRACNENLISLLWPHIGPGSWRVFLGEDVVDESVTFIIDVDRAHKGQCTGVCIMHVMFTQLSGYPSSVGFHRAGRCRSPPSYGIHDSD